MEDILVCTQPERLLHKRGMLPGDADHSPTGDYYWHLPRRPKRTGAGARIYFATQGVVRGYFRIDDIKALETYVETDVCFNSSSWKDVAPVKITPSQGFRYYGKAKA